MTVLEKILHSLLKHFRANYRERLFFFKFFQLIWFCIYKERYVIVLWFQQVTMFPYGDITFAFLGITLLFFDIPIYLIKSGMAVDRGFINKFITALCQCTS